MRRIKSAVIIACAFLMAGCSNVSVTTDNQYVQEETESDQDQVGQEETLTTIAREAEHGTMEIRGEFEVPEDISDAVFAYMERYYSALADLTMVDMEDLFLSLEESDISLNRNAWDYLIQLRGMQTSDLKLDSYEYALTVTEIGEETEDSFQISLHENNIQRFAQHPQVDSEYYNIRHNFQFVKEDGEWKIKNHVQSDGIYQNLLSEGGGSEWESSDVDTYFTSRKKALLQQAGEEKTSRDESGKSPYNYSRWFRTSHPYDAQAAIAYADSWVGKRNENWDDFTGMGGNCQNFVSQCLYAGGIPRDISGADTWSWARKDTDMPENRENALPWINVEAFRRYAASNRGYGLLAWADAPYYEGTAGDVIEMGFPQRWSHTVLITQVITDDQGNTIDYLIDSNTADLKNVPVSAYSLPRQSLIKIFGWND